MLDKLLSFGSFFNWLTPLFAFLQDLVNGPSVGYTVPLAAGWSTLSIRRYLRSSGIKVWGVMLFRNKILLRVRKAQARYAQILMERAEIPYAGGINTGELDHLRSVSHPQYKSQRMEQYRHQGAQRNGLPTMRWLQDAHPHGRTSLYGAVDDLVDELLRGIENRL